MKYGLSSSTPPRMSAPSSVCSDDSFEIVNNEVDIDDLKEDVFSIYKPKVTFHEVFDVYPMDADIVAKVTFDHDYQKSDQDTVVVLPIAWKSVDQALCAASVNGSYVRFDVKDLPKIGAEDKFYQLCYCTADKIVMGVSIPFSFREVHEDELVEFQKEQNKEFWTFRSRFAVLTDNYWNSLMEIQAAKAGEDKPTQVLEAGSAGVENSTPESVSINEKSTDESRDKVEELAKLADNNSMTENVFLFKLMEAEQDIIKQQNQKLKATVFEILRALSTDDRKPCHQKLNDAVNSSAALFTPDEFNELDGLLEKSINVPRMSMAKSSENLPEASDLHHDIDDSCDVVALNAYANEKILLFKIMEDENAELKKQYEEEARLHAETQNTNKILEEEKTALKKQYEELARLHAKTQNTNKILEEEKAALKKQYEEEVRLHAEAQTTNHIWEKEKALILNKCKEKFGLLSETQAINLNLQDEKAELLKQYEEEVRLRAEAENINKAFKGVLMETLRSTQLPEQVQLEIEKSLPVISPVFEEEEVNQVRDILKRRRIDSLKELVEKQMNKFEVEFVGTSDGNILLATQCDKQVATEAPKTTAHESVKKWEAKIAVLAEERDKLLTEVNEQQAIIKDLNEQLINQRQSEVEKMITVTNNMRDQFIKNMNQLTDSNKVMAQQLAEKDEEIETLNANLLDASKLLTANEREIRDLKDRDHTFMGFLERRNLKRISELRETLQEMYSKISAERQESAKLKDDLLTTQTLLNSLCDELEKSSCKKSMENSAQTGDDVSNVSGTSSMSSPEPPVPEVPSTSAGFRRIKQREQALATKLVEMTADLEKMRTIHDKTKTDLESRLKDGAKQYAKLYMKYEKLAKRSQQPRSREPSN